MAAGDKLTYQDLTEIIEMVAPGVALQTNEVSALLTAMGFPQRMGNTFSIQHKWEEQTLNPNSTLTTAISLAADTSLDVTAGTGTRFVAGDHLQAGGSREIMVIDAGGVAADVLTVTRGHLGTTAADIASGETITRIAHPALEKRTAGSPTAHSLNELDNYTQIFEGEIFVSNSRKKVKNKGDIVDMVKWQLMILQKDKLRDLARAVINSRRHNTTPQGSDTIPRTMDGLIYQILDAVAAGDNPSIVDAATAALDIALLDSLLRDMWEKGGTPNALIAGPGQHEALANVVEGRRRYTSTEKVAGGRVNEYVSKFGDLKVLPSERFVPDDVILAVDLNKLRIVKLGAGNQPFDIFPQGKDGTADEVIFEGEFTLEAKNAAEGGHGLLHNLSRA